MHLCFIVDSTFTPLTLLQLELRQQVRHCKKLARKWFLQHQQHIVRELNEAWHLRKTAQVWRLARHLTFKGVGPKKRNFKATKLQNYSSADWERFAAPPATDGGLSAHKVDRTQLYNTYIDEQPPQPPIRKDGLKTSGVSLKALSQNGVPLQV